MAITSKNIRDIRTGFNKVGIECHYVEGNKLALKWDEKEALYDVHRKILDVFDSVIKGYVICFERKIGAWNTCVIDLEG